MIQTVKDLIEELQKYPSEMRVGLDIADSWGNYLSNYIELKKEEADLNNYEFKNYKNENFSNFVDVLVIS